MGGDMQSWSLRGDNSTGFVPVTIGLTTFAMCAKEQLSAGGIVTSQAYISVEERFMYMNVYN